LFQALAHVNCQAICIRVGLLIKNVRAVVFRSDFCR